MNKRDKITTILLILIIILGLSLSITLGYIYTLDNKEDVQEVVGNNKNEEIKEEEKKEERIIAFSTKKELLSIVGLTENGYKRLDEESIKKLDLDGNNWIDYKKDSIINIILGLDNNKDINISEIDKDVIISLIKAYAYEDKLIKEGIIDNSKVDYCSNIKETCDGLKNTDFKLISEKYGIRNNNLIIDSNRKYEDYYLFYRENEDINPHKIEDKILFEYDGNDINLIYDVKISKYENNEYFMIVNKKVKFLFKMNSDGKYYLNVVKIVNN